MKIAVFAFVALLSGCVTQNTMLKNSNGQAMNCSGWGFGLIGASVALAQHADCMKKAHAAGYSEAPVQTN